jgi:hypothetical protein
MARTPALSIGTLRVQGASNGEASAIAREFQARAGELEGIAFARGSAARLRLEAVRASGESAGEAARRALAAHFGSSSDGR